LIASWCSRLKVKINVKTYRCRVGDDILPFEPLSEHHFGIPLSFCTRRKGPLRIHSDTGGCPEQQISGVERDAHALNTREGGDIIAKGDIPQLDERSIKGHLLIEPPGKHVGGGPVDRPLSTEMLDVVSILIDHDTGDEHPVISGRPFIHKEAAGLLGIASDTRKISILRNDVAVGV